MTYSRIYNRYRSLNRPEASDDAQREQSGVNVNISVQESSHITIEVKVREVPGTCVESTLISK
jgi:hypothetical protein